MKVGQQYTLETMKKKQLIKHFFYFLENPLLSYFQTLYNLLEKNTSFPLKLIKKLKKEVIFIELKFTLSNLFRKKKKISSVFDVVNFSSIIIKYRQIIFIQIN